MDIINAEAEAEGPEAVEALALLETYYSLFMDFQILRRKRGWTQKQLAEASGVPQAEISRIESGKANPTIATLGQLVRALHGRLRIVEQTARRRATHTPRRDIKVRKLASPAVKAPGAQAKRLHKNANAR